MYMNSFSVRIPQGVEQNGYALMKHNTKYSLSLKNDGYSQCDARVEIDGKVVGTWRLFAHSRLELERPADDEGQFTFYTAKSKEGKSIGLKENNPDLGLIKVTFTPDRTPVFTITSTWSNSGIQKGVLRSCDDTPSDAARCMYMGSTMMDSMSAGTTATSMNQMTPPSVEGAVTGGTGLSGKSDQQFIDVGPLDNPDYALQTVIMLRLVEKDTSSPRPLVAANSTPYPPPVNK